MISRAENRVLALMPFYSDKQIAKKLHIAVETVKSHNRSIFQKLGIENRTDASIYYLYNIWLPELRYRKLHEHILD